MNCIQPRSIWVDGTGFVATPCGKCIPCLMNRRTDWSFRLREEHKVSTSAHFVTLTYDPKHMPSDRSLDKKHLQNYMKRLRKIDGSNRLRYFAVGEYGSQTRRPHYHLLLFNCTAEHAQLAWRDSKGAPIGLVHIGTVTPASVAYCTKYIIQPDVAVFDSNLQKPFSLMSRAYGIGGHYLSQEMIAWHRAGDRNYAIHEDGIKSRLPRFYREKIWPSIPKDQVHRYNVQFNIDRKRVSEKAMALTLEQQEKERNYYKAAHGSNWLEVMTQSRDAMLSRVRQKVAFSQKTI